MASNRDEPLSFTNSSSPITVTDGDSFLIDPIGSASGSFQNDGLLGGDSGSNSDAEFGFSRAEFGQKSLVGSVGMYERHVFLCYKNPQVWPPRIEAAEFDRLPRLLSATMVARKGDMMKQTLLTICEGHDGTETSNGDVLIFPDMIRYRRLTHFDVDTFVEEVLVKNGEWLPGTPEPLKGFHVFICSHWSRDRRCGVCGPVLVTRFKEEIEAHGLQGKVSVSPCSHIGGHKYAGNVIIFGSSINGEVTGHWYGYVAPDDVPILLKQHIGKGETVDWLWRGQMGLSEEDQRKCHDLRLQVNGGFHIGENTKEEILVKVTGATEEVMGCCQENESSSCCQNPVLSENTDNKLAAYDSEEKVASKKKKSKKKQLSRNNSIGKGASTRKVFTTPTLFESWEREDTYAALSVVCAAVSIAVAYGCYKQWR